MSDLAVVAAMIGVVIVGIVFLSRSRESLWGRYWALAWIAFYAGALVTVAEVGPLGFRVPMMMVTASSFSGLLLAGALHYAGRRVSGWLFLAYPVLGAVRSALFLAGHPALSFVLALSIEPATDLGAARLVAGAGRRRPGVIARYLLPAAVVAVAAVDGADAVVSLGGNDPAAVHTAWMAVSLSTIALMFGARLEGTLWRAHALRESLAERTAGLANRRDLLKAVFDLTPAGLLLSGGDHRVIAANRCQAEWLGLDDPQHLVGRPLREALLPAGTRLPASLEAVFELAADGAGPAVHQVDVEVAGPPRRVWLVDTYAVRRPSTPAERVWLSRDVTEQRRLERELAANETAETLGRLAGGIAHDFNNHLTVVAGNAELLLDELPGDDARRELLDELLGAVGHCSDLTASLVAFCQPARAAAESVQPAELLQQVHRLVRPALTSATDLEVSAAPSLPDVFLRPDRLVQALLHLALDARDAMAVLERLEIAADRVQVEQPPGSAGALVSGEYVRFTVRALGDASAPPKLATLLQGGILTENRTPREGLGFAIVFGFLSEHGGFVTAESHTDGTAVQLHVPTTS